MTMSDATQFTRALLGQGLGLGWGDEAEAWLRSRSIMGGRPYEQELEDIRREYGEFAQRRPKAAFATELAGGVLPALAAALVTPATGGAAAPVAAGALGRIAANPVAQGVLRAWRNPVGRGVITGVLSGGVAGAGTAEEGERLPGFAVGSALGGGMGGVMPLAFRGASSVADWLRERIAPSAETVTKGATRRVRRALERADEGAGISPQEAAQRIAEDRARGIPSTLANVDQSLVGLAEVVGQRPGASADIVKQQLEPQLADARERVMGRTGRALKAGRYYDEEQALASDLRTRARDLYEDAYSFGTVDDDRILAVLQQPQFKRFFDKARDIADTEKMAARLRGEDPSKYELTPIYMMDAAGNITETVLPDVRTLDYIKRGIDTVIERGFEGEGISKAEASALRDLRRQFVNAIDEATIDPDTGVSAYALARRDYAGDMEVLDAMRTAREKFSRLPPEEVADFLSTASRSEVDAFRTGAFRNIYDSVMGTSNNINAAKKIINSPLMVERLRPLFDSQAQFNLYKAALLRESQLFEQGQQILKGSATARRLQALEEFNEGASAGEFVGNLITSGFDNSLTNLVGNLARSAKMPEEIAAETSRLLMSSNPAEVAAAVKILEEYGAKAAVGAKNLTAAEMGAIMGATTAMMPAPDPRTEGPSIERALEESRRIPGAALTGPSIDEDLRKLREGQ
jgi:hypothetical protein